MAARRTRLRLIVALWLSLLASGFPLPGFVSAQTQPDYGIYVSDGADVIAPRTESELYARALWLKENTGTAQVGVVTVRSLEGRTIEEQAVSVFRKLGLGGRERNDGVLLLYSAEEGRVRIEVGYGLEGRIPDGKAGAMLDDYFVPYRDAGDLDRAFSLTQSAIVREAAAEFGLDATNVTEGLPAPSAGPGSGEGWFAGLPGYMKLLIGLAVVFLIILDFKLTGGAITFSLLNLLGRRGGGSGGGFGGGKGGGGSSGGGGASR